MGYKEEMLKKIQRLKEYDEQRRNNPDEALKFKNLFPVWQDYLQVSHFLRRLNSNVEPIFGSKAGYRGFVDSHQDLLKMSRIPIIASNDHYGTLRFPDVDFEKIFDALEKETQGGKDALEALYREADPNIRAVNHPLTGIVENIKKDAVAFYGEGPDAEAIKAALDYANEEIVEKKGTNVIDDVVDINSCVRSMKANRELDAFIEKKGLDKTKIVNRSGSRGTFSPGLQKKAAYSEDFKPILSMEPSYSQEYKDKLLKLDELLESEGLLKQAAGGESGSKEYGLADYFQKNYALKKVIADYPSLTEDAQKQAAIENIKKLTKEVQDVSAKYDKVFHYINENFDLDDVSLPGNLYSGRPAEVHGNDVVKWRPNLPPKFDFENSPAVIFLSGFTQLKAASQIGEVSLKDYLDHPGKSYLAGAKKVAAIDDRKMYLPRSEENTLGKRIAHAFYSSNKSYSELSSYFMAGGRGLEFLYNLSPDKETQNDNIITSSVFKEFGLMNNHDPATMFGREGAINLTGFKNIFAAGDTVDALYELSPDYVNDKGELAAPDYVTGVKARGNVSVADEYRRIVNTVKDFNLERQEMSKHKDLYLKFEKDTLHEFSCGAFLCAGRQYFVDYLKENNLSLASVEDPALREEITEFLCDPVKTFDQKHQRLTDAVSEDIDSVRRGFKENWDFAVKKDSEHFFENFASFNNKPRGYNAGKPFRKILDDNKGGWYERFRGTTSKEYTALQKVARAASDPTSPTYGDKESLYVCAKAYRAYKLPEGADFNRLSKTAKKRIEFCDSIIADYEAEERAKQAANNPAAAAQSNNIIDQKNFQNQIQNELEPKAPSVIENVEKQPKSNEIEGPNVEDVNP